MLRLVLHDKLRPQLTSTAAVLPEAPGRTARALAAFAARLDALTPRQRQRLEELRG